MRIVMLLAGMLGLIAVAAQEKGNAKFGKITPADFEISSPLIDSNTNAVVLSDIGRAEIVSNDLSGFALEYTRHCRIKLLNAKGFDIAVLRIPLYNVGGQRDDLRDLSAATYNLDNGTVTVTKVGSKDIFTEEVQKHEMKKFTFPALQPGAIIEYEYTIRSNNYFGLHPWQFQGEYPCLRSEYSTVTPSFIRFVSLAQGYLPFAAKDVDTYRKQFFVQYRDLYSAPHTGNLSTVMTTSHWVVTNAPALKPENFTSTIRNHISQLEFQLVEYDYPNERVIPVMGSWETASEKLMGREQFGQAINGPNEWLDDELKQVVSAGDTKDQKARKIYAYVRNSFTCTGRVGFLMGKPLKEVVRSRNGTVADINLMLIAMLRRSGIACEPVLLSLRERGIVHPIYPLINRFNYVICEVKDDGSEVFLDASNRALGYGKLPADCYNGVAWEISVHPRPVNFYTDSVTDARRTAIVIANNEKNELAGSVNTIMGDFSSTVLRSRIDRRKQETYKRELAQQYGSDIKVDQVQIDSLNSYDEPLVVNYNISIRKPEEEMFYFNPMLGHGIRGNPFTSEKRLYPVEMPYRTAETVVLTMDIPAGYKVEELPKSVRYNLNDDEGSFEYIIAIRDNKIQFRSVFKLNKATFAQEDYESLREFYGLIIKKQGDQIVFKKL